MYAFLHYTVADAMTRAPVTVPVHTTLLAVERLFEQHQFNAIPVVSSDGRLMGMATKVDLLKAFRFGTDRMVPDYEAIMSRKIDSVMTRTPVCLNPDTPLTRALEHMVDLGVRSFPVISGERLEGMIARSDVLAALRRATTERAS